MKRWLFNLAGTGSLLLLLAAAVAWALSYARPIDWRLLGTAHSAGLTRVDADQRRALLMTPVSSSSLPPHGFWDAVWARSEAGTLSLLAQAADFGDNLRSLHASPPSLAAVLSGAARAQAVATVRVVNSPGWARELGFAWDADAGQAIDGDGLGGVVTVKARLIVLPYWFIVLLCLPLPLLWLRANRWFRRAPQSAVQRNASVGWSSDSAGEAQQRSLAWGRAAGPTTCCGSPRAFQRNRVERLARPSLLRVSRAVDRHAADHFAFGGQPALRLTHWPFF